MTETYDLLFVSRGPTTWVCTANGATVDKCLTGWLVRDRDGNEVARPASKRAAMKKAAGL